MLQCMCVQLHSVNHQNEPVAFHFSLQVGSNSLAQVQFATVLFRRDVLGVANIEKQLPIASVSLQEGGRLRTLVSLITGSTMRTLQCSLFSHISYIQRIPKPQRLHSCMLYAT